MQEIKIDEPKKYNLCEIFSDAGAFLVATSLPYKAERTSIKVDKKLYMVFKAVTRYVRKKFRLRGYTKLTTFAIEYGLKKIKNMLNERGVKSIDDVKIPLTSRLYSMTVFPRFEGQKEVINIYRLQEIKDIVDVVEILFYNRATMYTVALNEFLYDLLSCNILDLDEDDVRYIKRIHNDLSVVMDVFSNITKGKIVKNGKGDER